MNNTKVSTPQLSVIVCTYNREKYILRNLESFINQTADYSEFEIVIINNNSPDNTDEICKAFIDDNPEIQITYIIEKQQGLSHARNRGIKESKSNILAFIDDDAFIKSDYCEKVLTFFSSNPDAYVVGGKIIPIYESGKEPIWMSPYLETLMAAQNLGEKTKRFPKNKFPIGANMIFNASAFNDVGLFNINLGRRGSNLEGGEEKEIMLKIRSLNKKIIYSPEIIVDHIIPPKREQMKYIKQMGIGIGVSEIIRIKKYGFSGITYKIFQEFFKWTATVILFIYYLLLGKTIKGLTLIKFRYWVLVGLLMNKKA